MEDYFQHPFQPFRVPRDAFQTHQCPAVFQALINDVLWDMLNKFIFVYLGDILSFSESEEDSSMSGSFSNGS